MIMKSSLDSCLFPIARMVYAATRLGKAALNLRTEIFPDTNATTRHVRSNGRFSESSCD
jgi:hypothetical protein